MSDTKTVLAQIEELVQSQTFTAAALDGIQAIKRQLAETLNECDKWKHRYEAKLNQCKELEALSQQQAAQISVMRSEINAHREQHAKAAEAIYDAKRHEAVAQAWKEAMQTVFKPNAVRETIARSVVRPVEGSPGGNGSWPSPGFLAQGQEAETVTREDA